MDPHDPTAPALDVRGLHAGYRRSPVLHGVDLAVAPGETVALLGRNGAGKTTLLRTLMGLLRPISGDCLHFGKSVAKHPVEVRRRVGYLAEDQPIWPWMRVREVVRFVSAFYPTWDDDLAATLIRRFELPREQKVRELSKGQNVRLGLALALAHRPPLAVLDDPALGLDPVARRQFNSDLVDQLQGEGAAVLYSSHLLGEVEAVADRVAILQHGRVAVDRPPDDLRAEVQLLRLHDTGMPAPLPLPPGAVLSDRVRGSERLVVVREAERHAATLRAGGAEVRVEELSLDDIFIALEAASVAAPRTEAA